MQVTVHNNNNNDDEYDDDYDYGDYDDTDNDPDYVGAASKRRRAFTENGNDVYSLTVRRTVRRKGGEWCGFK